MTRALLDRIAELEAESGAQNARADHATATAQRLATKIAAVRRRMLAALPAKDRADAAMLFDLDALDVEGVLTADECARRDELTTRLCRAR